MKLFKNLKSAMSVREEVEALKVNLTDEKFPLELFDFPNLRELYLEGSCTHFPEHALFWKQLKTLSIKWPLFNGDLSPVFRLPQLEILKILETPLKALHFFREYSPAPLKSLTLKDCGLTVLPEELSLFWQLQDLNLSGNKLRDLPQSLRGLASLKRLNLDSNSFSTFPDHVSELKTLSHLSIDRNPFSEEEVHRIQRQFNLYPEG